jgi:protein-serine/threonine kinase
LGRGSSGKVTLSRRTATGLLYAIKSIRKDKLSRTELEYRVIAERNCLMRAVHPFITRLYWAFQSWSRFYFVLEYVPGGDLRHHLNHQVEFSPRQIQLFLAEITIALQTLHRLGIIYRDLKPENILVDATGHVKLADFGLVREIEREIQEQGGTMCGTREYLAPEMIRHEPQSPSLDFWALGVLAYRLMVGFLPFQTENVNRLFDMIVNRNPKIPSTIEPAAADLIKKLLMKEPAKRLGAIGTDIQAHPYFEGLSWEAVVGMEVVPDFRPVIMREDQATNFDEEFTSQPPVGSFGDDSPVIEVPVTNFSFQGDE